MWPTLLLLLGIERVRIVPHFTSTNAFDFAHYLFTHSLVAEVMAGLLLGLVYWLVRRNAQGALRMGLLVPSHWLLDLVVPPPLYRSTPAPGRCSVLGSGTSLR